MNDNIFDLTTLECKDIASDLQKKIEEGLQAKEKEILAIPTYISPKKVLEDERVLVLDWGGTTFRAAIVEFKNGKPEVIERVKRLLSAEELKRRGISDADGLMEAMAKGISELVQLDKRVVRIGYCFSYPAESLPDGDALLIRWTKGIDIPDMVGKPVGKLLLDFLNGYKDIKTSFTDIKVINDTVACLFGGMSEKNMDRYIGLIVGTGTNMAALMPMNKIGKLNSKKTDLVPVNLESGNFHPPYLTIIDELVDTISNSKGAQRFEKAVSGGYLGEIFRMVFYLNKFRRGFDAKDINDMMNDPLSNDPEQVAVASWIYKRSAQLVAASLAGLIEKLVAQDGSVKDICITADGSLFWSEVKSASNYNEIVSGELEQLLLAFGHTAADIDRIKIVGIEDINLIGSAIAAVSDTSDKSLE